MRFIRTFQTAIHALQRNVMRAILTTLGIIIGIAAVIAMVEIGNGSADQIQKTIASLGANSLLINPGSTSSGGVSAGSGTGMTLTPDDCDAILRECPEVLYAAPVVRVRTQVIYGNRNWRSAILNLRHDARVFRMCAIGPTWWKVLLSPTRMCEIRARFA